MTWAGKMRTEEGAGTARIVCLDSCFGFGVWVAAACGPARALPMPSWPTVAHFATASFSVRERS